jgi:hypothetical protein
VPNQSEEILQPLVKEKKEQSEQDHYKELLDWVNNLPDSKPTKYFGDFRFDVDAIMQAML